MGRLRLFPDNRFIGRRDEMRVYDCDDEKQYALLNAALEDQRLVEHTLLQTFAPDTLAEAENRCFVGQVPEIF